MNLDKKKAGMAVAGIAVLGVAGWLAWDMFMGPPPPPPVVIKAKPPAVKPAVQAEISPDKLISEVIVVSGLRKSIDQIPEKVLQGARQSSSKAGDPAVVAEIEKIMTDVFKAERFHARVQEAMKKDFDRKRMEGLLKTLSTPLMKKMAELEGQDVKPEALAAYAKGLAANPLPKERVQLLQDYNAATKTTDFAVELVIVTTRAMVTGMLGGDAAKMKAFEKDFDKQKSKLTEAMHNAMMITLAYVYKDVSDADFREYVKFSTTDDGKWFSETAMNAMLDEFRVGAGQTGERLAEWTKTRKQAVAATKGKAVAVPAAKEVPVAAPAATEARVLTARSKLDARECLKQETNQAIHRCAEGFR